MFTEKVLLELIRDGGALLVIIPFAFFLLRSLSRETRHGFDRLIDKVEELVKVVREDRRDTNHHHDEVMVALNHHHEETMKALGVLQERT